MFCKYKLVLNKCNRVKPGILLSSTRCLYTNLPRNWHNFYNEITFKTDSKHLHYILDNYILFNNVLNFKTFIIILRTHFIYIFLL